MRGRDVVVPRYEAHGSWDVDESVGAVEDGQCRLMITHKPHLHVVFSPRKEELEWPVLFEFEHLQTMVFSHLPYLLGEYLSGDDFRHAVEEVGDDPVEHFDQEGKLLEDTAVKVVCKSRGIWSVQSEATESPPLWKVL